MMDYQPFYQWLAANGLSEFTQEFEEKINQALRPERNREIPHWQTVLRQLPVYPADHLFLTTPAVSVSGRSFTPAESSHLKELLMQWHPWRKGPFRVHDVYIDTEWRSDLKWARVEKAQIDLQDRLVLDVGSGNGYYGWRMLGAGARAVIGIDPFLKNVFQFWAIRHFMGELPLFVLPLGIEDFPDTKNTFDVIFSMGLLYHRRSPIDHLTQLHSWLKPGGKLVLETLVINGDEQTVLMPLNRYAKMRNVWFIPSPSALKIWLHRSGYGNIQVIDVTRTTVQEQRSTEWMRFESLPDFLDPNDPLRTIEGYPAPTRALLVAQKN